jgi:hypothetical protein
MGMGMGNGQWAMAAQLRNFAFVHERLRIAHSSINDCRLPIRPSADYPIADW